MLLAQKSHILYIYIYLYYLFCIFNGKCYIVQEKKKRPLFCKCYIAQEKKMKHVK